MLTRRVRRWIGAILVLLYFLFVIGGDSVARSASLRPTHHKAQWTRIEATRQLPKTIEDIRMAAPEPKPSKLRTRECDIEQYIGDVLTQTARAYRLALNAELAPYDVTIRQSQVLGRLRKNGDLSQCQLARFLAIEPATLAGVLERMERDGLILRIADQSDCRRKLIRLNRHAEELGETVAECSARVCARAVQGLSPGEIDSLHELLKRILENLSEH